MKNQNLLAAIAAAVSLLGIPLARAQAPAQSQVKISINDARTAALRQVPGTVVEEQLEHENGVDVYSFEVRPNQKSGTIEVNVDANSGAIVAVENRNHQAPRADLRKQFQPIEVRQPKIQNQSIRRVTFKREARCRSGVSDASLETRLPEPASQRFGQRSRILDQQ